MRRRSQLIPWKVAGRVTEGYSSGDDVVRSTGWVFNNAVGDDLTLAEFVASGDDEVPAYLEAFGLRGEHNASQSMLEIGAGIGRMTAAFTREYGTVVAADLDIGFLERCHETVAAHGNVERLRTLEVADGRSIAMADDSVDMAFSYITLQHCARGDAMHLITEAIRVVRPGGTVVLNLRAPSRLDPVLLPTGALIRASFRLPRVGEWLSQRRWLTRIGWQVSRLSPPDVLAAVEATVRDAQVWTRPGAAITLGDASGRQFDGINPSHWWLVATVVG